MGLLMSVHYLIYITSCRSLMEKNRPVMVPHTVAAKFHANKLDANKLDANKKDQEVKKLMPQMDAAYRIPRRAASKMEGCKECKKEGINNG